MTRTLNNQKILCVAKKKGAKSTCFSDKHINKEACKRNSMQFFFQEREIYVCGANMIWWRFVCVRRECCVSVWPLMPRWGMMCVMVHFLTVNTFLRCRLWGYVANGWHCYIKWIKNVENISSCFSSCSKCKYTNIAQWYLFSYYVSKAEGSFWPFLLAFKNDFECFWWD